MDRDVLKEMLDDKRLKRLLEYGAYTRARRLGVDTKFIVDAASVDPAWPGRFRRESWSDTEGERSAFIDLAEGTMAPCSFGGTAVKLEGYDAPSLLKAFVAIGVYRPQGVGDPL